MELLWLIKGGSKEEEKQVRRNRGRDKAGKILALLLIEIFVRKKKREYETREKGGMEEKRLNHWPGQKTQERCNK